MENCRIIYLVDLVISNKASWSFANESEYVEVGFFKSGKFNFIKKMCENILKKFIL